MYKSPTYILTLSCEDRPGIVADVAGYLASCGGNVLEAQQFDDTETGNFFMRVVFAPSADNQLNKLQEGFAPIGGKYGMQFQFRDYNERQRVLLLVSKFDHCLVDLLYRTRINELKMDIVGIVSNHPKPSLALSIPEHIPFHYFPITKETKTTQEAQIRNVIEQTSTELVVLARYMQVLSDEFCQYLHGRCINIHHSFLPGFKGAKPYHQAHRRGVKMIGATAHYVTADLDEGPIILQDVEAISHADTPEDLVRKGRDIERRVLARAVAHHLDHRVFLNGSKTVVFRD